MDYYLNLGVLRITKIPREETGVGVREGVEYNLRYETHEVWEGVIVIMGGVMGV